MELVFLSGFLFMMFNELEDACVRGKIPRFREFMDSRVSWCNKWKCRKPFVDYEILEPLPYEKKWYHFGISPKFEERFPYSSTIFVFLTDGEHLFQFLKINAILISLYHFGLFYPTVFLLGTFLFSLIKESFFKFID